MKKKSLPFKLRRDFCSGSKVRGKQVKQNGENKHWNEQKYDLKTNQ